MANDYATFKNGMSEAVQTIKAATNTIESVKNILQQMKSVATSAKLVYILQLNKHRACKGPINGHLEAEQGGCVAPLSNYGMYECTKIDID